MNKTIPEKKKKSSMKTSSFLCEGNRGWGGGSSLVVIWFMVQDLKSNQQKAFTS